MFDYEKLEKTQREKHEITGALQMAMNYNGLSKRGVYQFDFDAIFDTFKKNEEVYLKMGYDDIDKEGICLALSLKDTKPFGNFTSSIAFDTMWLLRKKDTDNKKHKYSYEEVYQKEILGYTNMAKEVFNKVFSDENITSSDFFNRMCSFMTDCVYKQIDAIEKEKTENKKKMNKK